MWTHFSGHSAYIAFVVIVWYIDADSQVQLISLGNDLSLYPFAVCSLHSLYLFSSYVLRQYTCTCLYMSNVLLRALLTVFVLRLFPSVLSSRALACVTRRLVDSSPVHISNNVEAKLSNATSRTILSTKSNVALTKSNVDATERNFGRNFVFSTKSKQLSMFNSFRVRRKDAILR